MRTYSPVLLIDSNKVFKPGVKDNVIVARSSDAALAIVDEMKTFDEIWMDFILDGSDSIVDFLRGLKTRKNNDSLPEIKKFYYHASEESADELIHMWLTMLGYPETVFERVYKHENFLSPLSE